MSANTRIPSPQGDELDRLVTAYFRAEMPANWPAAPSVSGGSRHPARPDGHPARPDNGRAADPASKSRWALAASVAILIGGCWYLSGLATDGRPKKGPGLDGTTANPPKLIKDHMGDPKTKMP
jgi:hypothetical protein